MRSSLNTRMRMKISAPATPSSDYASSEESAAWSGIVGTWQPLHGSFFTRGMSLEWHDFRLEKDMDWSRSFHDESLEICLNFSGEGRIHDGEAEHAIAANQGAIYINGRERLKASRLAGSLHQFLTIELSAGFLRTHFGAAVSQLKAPVQRFAKADSDTRAHAEIYTLPAALLPARVQFVSPPVPSAARDTWFLGRVLEVLAQTLFPAEDPGELFCKRHQRTNRTRVERARYLIERDLENPPSLEMLAEEVGSSPFYLSRVFAQETGASIPKFLRMKRIERAAELIRSGKMNVTEAAMTVGYSSLSAFNKAFVEQIGCCPGLYPAMQHAAARKRRIA